MDTYVKSFLYPLVYTIVGGFGIIYLGVLLNAPKPFTTDVLIRYVAAGFFSVVFIGAIVSWLLDCPFPFGLPTFGLEDRPYVIG